MESRDAAFLFQALTKLVEGLANGTIAIRIQDGPRHPVIVDFVAIPKEGD